MNKGIADKLLIIYAVGVYFAIDNAYENILVYGGFLVVLVFGVVMDYVKSK